MQLWGRFRVRFRGVQGRSAEAPLRWVIMVREGSAESPELSQAAFAGRGSEEMGEFMPVSHTGQGESFCMSVWGAREGLKDPCSGSRAVRSRWEANGRRREGEGRARGVGWLSARQEGKRFGRSKDSQSSVLGK